ncbi:MAG: cupin domain-containing protein [Chloroflexota bacterium]|nr:cupin domain-containing protein [Chloroflexota bacterium]
MFNQKTGSGYSEPIEGIRMKTIVYGENTLMAEFVLDKGAVLPEHSHPQEQTGYLVKGHIIISIDGEEFDVTPGDSWSIPGDAVHGAKMIDDSIAVEVFSPVRQDYLPEG